MPPVEFPSPETADEYGIVAVGGKVDAETLLAAYSRGIFPWPLPEIEPIVWFSPPQRAVLHFKDFTLSRSTLKGLRRAPFEIKVDTNFEAVLLGCAAPRAGHDDTWITEEIQHGYLELHRMGFAHSVESYHDGRLVGGLYGVSINGMFCGESMFYRAPNASKAALAALVTALQQRGVEWIDCQVMNTTFRKLGATNVPRKRFLSLLEKALERDIRLFPW